MARDDAAMRDELEEIRRLLSGRMTLDAAQPHLTGERFLLGGANKFVLLAHEGDRRIVVKASKDPSGIAEIVQEKRVRDALKTLPFAHDSIRVPAETYYAAHGPYTISASEYIDQKEVLAARPLEERFFMALRAFEVQDAFHASTREHLRSIRGVFPVYDAMAYISSLDTAASAAVSRARDALAGMSTEIDRYTGFLTHSDFVPHNIRLSGRTLWFLDCFALRFGNKHESRARFVNYMLIHDPELAGKLLEYWAQEHAEETSSLHALRTYKAAFLVAFYARALPRVSGALAELTHERLSLWEHIADALASGQPIDPERIATYRTRRNALRSDEERERQKLFNQVG